MAQPPLPYDEACRILERLRPLTDERRIVVIGGQAVALWARELRRRGCLSTPISGPLTSKDLDLRGAPTTVERTAELLNGRARLPRVDDATTNTGLVEFRDSKGIARVLDFLDAPYGASGRDVQDTAITIHLPWRGRAVPVRLMHPERLMESRVRNVIGLKTTGSLALAQARASVGCTRGFARLLLEDDDLDAAEARRHVLKLNERVFRFALRDRSARRIVREHGIDPFEAVLVDPRLGAAFVERRYPQMRARLSKLPERRPAQ